MAKKKAGESVTFAVTLKAPAVQKTTVGLGFEFEREALPLEKADALLVGARLQVSLLAVKGQGELFDGPAPEPLESVADCHSLGVKGQTISARLTFRRGDVDMQALIAIGFRSARLTATRIGDASKHDEEDAT